MLSGILKIVKTIKKDNYFILFRSKSLSPQPRAQQRQQQPPLYIYKNPNVINRITRASSLKKSVKKYEYGVNQLKTVIPTMMYAKIIVFINNRPYICIIDGNYTVNTIPCTMFYNFDGVVLSTRNLLFNLEHSIFILQFIMGQRIILGKQFVERYVDNLDCQYGIMTLKNNVKLDIYNEIPNDVISICINEEYFLAHIDATHKHSILSLEMLDKLQCDTTQTQVNVHCVIQTEYIIPFEFDNLFYVVDNHNKYVILGLDFLTTYCTRIGKHYTQLKNKLRVYYISS